MYKSVTFTDFHKSAYPVIRIKRIYSDYLDEALHNAQNIDTVFISDSSGCPIKAHRILLSFSSAVVMTGSRRLKGAWCGRERRYSRPFLFRLYEPRFRFSSSESWNTHGVVWGSEVTLTNMTIPFPSFHLLKYFVLFLLHYSGLPTLLETEFICISSQWRVSQFPLSFMSHVSACRLNDIPQLVWSVWKLRVRQIKKKK